MTLPAWFRSLIVIAIVGVCAFVPGAEAQTLDEVFDTSVVHDIRLFVNARDLRALRERAADNTFYPADLQWGATRLRNIGVRSRGNGSRNGSKLGLQLEFGRYVGGQRFGGLSALTLDNLWQDASMLRERVAMAFMTRMGLPASRESFARVYINNAYEGLYALVEPVDAQYLIRTLGEADGLLFEYRWVRPYYFTDLGDDLTTYEQLFEERLQQRGGAATYAPLRDLVREIAQPVDDAWRERVEAYLDLPQIVTYFAIEQFLAEEDGLAGYDGMNNVYLYRGSGTERHLFLPWDRDHTFFNEHASVFQRVQENALLAAMLTVPDLHALFLDTLARCAALALEDDWLVEEITGSAALIAEAAAQDVRKPYSTELHVDSVAFLLEFARVRPGIVLQQLRGAGVP